jgi:uncharacterized membrane protein (UPF0127 family)
MISPGGRLMRRCLKMVIACLLWLAAPADGQAAPRTIELSAGGSRIEAEYAETPESRDTGLMERHSLPANHGMLFIFPEAHRHCMWMLNTHIPLSVAFLDDEGVIVNIADMLPDTRDYHCADKPVRYALEMNRGWFEKKRIRPGARISGIGQAPPGR